MDEVLENKKRFFAALSDFKEDYGYGVQTYIAESTNKTSGYISRLFAATKEESKIEAIKISFELQVKIAKACNSDYISFLQHGKELLEGSGPRIKKKGNSQNPRQKPPLPYDGAEERSNSALKDMELRHLAEKNTLLAQALEAKTQAYDNSELLRKEAEACYKNAKSIIWQLQRIVDACEKIMKAHDIPWPADMDTPSASDIESRLDLTMHRETGTGE